MEIVTKPRVYVCKLAFYNRGGTSKAQRRLALTLYLEGLGFRFMGQILGFSPVAVYSWIKSFGEPIETLKQKEARHVEIDEIHRNMGHKK